jgi:8-oxo-dGTP pyrophosphatase MutT (NUDIX family)
MNNNETISIILNNYLEFFPPEALSLDLIAKLLKSDSSILTRENTSGHVTASGLVIKDDTVALIFHNKLQKYIQPGGHVEDDNSLHETALREVKEETGMTVVLHPWHSEHSYIPLNIDIHKIPYNEKKQELEHYHYDFTYVFIPINIEQNLQLEEVSDLKWIPISNNFNERLLDKATQKIKHFKLV